MSNATGFQAAIISTRVATIWQRGSSYDCTSQHDNTGMSFRRANQRHRPFQGDNTTPPAVFTVVITNGHLGSTTPEWPTFSPHWELTFILTKHTLSRMKGRIVGSFSRGWEDVHAQSMFCAHVLNLICVVFHLFISISFIAFFYVFS
jgi:hypothetical protein